MRIGLRNPVRLGPSQRNADRRGATQDDAEHDRHHGGDRQGTVLSIDDRWCAEAAHDDDAVERPDRDDDTVDQRRPSPKTQE